MNDQESLIDSYREDLFWHRKKIRSSSGAVRKNYEESFKKLLAKLVKEYGEESVKKMFDKKL